MFRLIMLCILFVSLNAVAGSPGDIQDKFEYRNKVIKFEITRAGHVTAFYTSRIDGRVISLSVIRGEKNDLAVDPDAPLYALDIKISDNDDFTIAAQSGAGHFVDQSWGKKLGKVPPSLEKRAQDVSELGFFAVALRDQVKPKLERSALSEWAWIVDEMIQLLEYVDMQSKMSPAFGSNVPEAAITAATTYRNIVTIKKKKAFDIVFEHSSLSSNVYTSSGKFLYSIITCNHGACASSSSMRTKCSKTFTQSKLDAYASDLLCDLYGWPYPVHVCNNDTRAQYRSIKNRSKGTWSSCSSPLLYAPSCE